MKKEGRGKPRPQKKGTANMNTAKIAELEEKIKVRKKIIAKKTKRIEALDKALVKIIGQIETLEGKRRELNIKRQTDRERIPIHARALRTLEAYRRLAVTEEGGFYDKETKDET
jgi:predicted nucleic acid-binding protein